MPGEPSNKSVQEIKQLYLIVKMNIFIFIGGRICFYFLCGRKRIISSLRVDMEKSIRYKNTIFVLDKIDIVTLIKLLNLYPICIVMHYNLGFYFVLLQKK
jgi:hypothetical protein